MARGQNAETEPAGQVPMHDDLDPSPTIEALSRPATADHVGRFRLDLATGAWTWPVLPAGPARHLDPRDVLSLSTADGAATIAEAVTKGAPVCGMFRVADGSGPARSLLVLVEPDLDGAEVVAAVGTVVDLGTERDELLGRADQLETALRSRPVIEQAKGMLMQLKGCSEDDAFRLLITLSQAVNRKLRDVAVEIVGALPAGTPLPRDIARALSSELGTTRRDGDTASRRDRDGQAWH
ncbi:MULTISPECIES: ANTAR domain-containing response regulator [Pseudonocardia]|nr:GAF and ANTAR domain-containing protein [Pseudonocardia dioxanivorans]GJF05462.1 hypothetical protein PSD17_44140 [Pseudonocardia sp. D17]